MGIEVKGLEALLGKLESLGGNVDEAMKRGTQSATRVVQSSAKNLCPADTGDLRASISTRYERDGDTHIGYVYTNKEHAAYVEFGTGPAGKGTYPYPVGPLQYHADKWRVNIPIVGVRWIRGQAAQPFLYPALLESKDNIIEAYEKALLKEIKKVIK